MNNSNGTEDNQNVVYFISKQIHLSNRKEKPLEFNDESPFSIKISGFNFFSKVKRKENCKEKLIQKLESKEILELIDNLGKFMKNGNNGNNNNFLENEFVIRIPYNEKENKKYKEYNSKEEENLYKEYQEDNYTLDFSLEIDINKEKIDKEKEYKVFIIRSDGYTISDLNKECIKKVLTIKKKNEFIMNNFHISYLGTLDEILKAKEYKINIPTNSTKISKGIWRFQFLIISGTNEIEYHKSYPFSTLTTNQMFREGIKAYGSKTNKRKTNKSKMNKSETNKSETNKKRTRRSYLTRIILKSEDKKIGFTERIKWIEILKYYRDIIFEGVENKGEEIKLDLKFTSTTQKKGEIKDYLEELRKDVDEILSKKNNITSSKEFMTFHHQNIFNEDVFNENLFSEKKYEKKLKKKHQISRITQLQGKDKGPVKLDESKYLDNTETIQVNKNKQHQEEIEGPIRADENQYLANIEVTQENRSEQHQEENEGPIRADENQYISEQLSRN